MTPTNFRPKTSVWFITGASSGFGHALAEAVLNRGHCVVATSRHTRDLQSLADRFPDRVLAAQLDVTDVAAAHAAVRQGVARLGRIDVVCNNAGFDYVSAIEELTDDELSEQIDVDLYDGINV